MSDARTEILARIRAANAGAIAPDVPRGYLRSGSLGVEEMLALFTDRLVDYRATVVDTTEAGIGAAVRTALPAGMRVLVPAGLPAAWAPAGAVVDDQAFGPVELDGFDAVVTGCAAAAATTGTIVLDARPDQGRRAISLVPDRHVCVVRAAQLVETVPELLARLDPVRPLTFVSGPSATSDIELQRVEGVHGPRTLIVVIAR